MPNKSYTVARLCSFSMFSVLNYPREMCRDLSSSERQRKAKRVSFSLSDGQGKTNALCCSSGPPSNTTHTHSGISREEPAGVGVSMMFPPARRHGPVTRRSPVEPTLAVDLSGPADSVCLHGQSTFCSGKPPADTFCSRSPPKNLNLSLTHPFRPQPPPPEIKSRPIFIY